MERNFGRRFPAAAVAGIWLYHGLWCRKRPRGAAALGTAMVVGMNAGGLKFGRGHIPAPRMLVAENIVFLGLAWLAAEQDARGPGS